jgi:hypothetical protein
MPASPVRLATGTAGKENAQVKPKVLRKTSYCDVYFNTHFMRHVATGLDDCGKHVTRSSRFQKLGKL